MQSTDSGQSGVFLGLLLQIGVFTTSTAAGSGDGSRPSTDGGGVANMGAGKKFTGEYTAAGRDTTGPAPVEKMQKRCKDAEAVKHDDPAA